jgi:TatA/E family protein of Tat protein translocase
MPTVLLVFEFLGTTELLVIAVVALIIFGPRKLPEIGRTVGKSLAEFKRASDDFKRTWEYEVELETRKPALDAAPAPAREAAAADATTLNSAGVDPEEFFGRASQRFVGGETVARSSPADDGGAQAATTEGARGEGEEEDEINAS